MERERVTVQEAARRLGISESGVRKRIKRQHLDSTHEEGRVYVFIDNVTEDMTEPDNVRDEFRDKYISGLEEQVEYLRDENRRKDETIMQQAISLRALAAPESLRDEQNPADSEREPQPEGETTPETAEANSKRPGKPWWRRIFGSV